MSPPPRIGWQDVLTLLLGYVVLDWASYVYPLHGLNITPWNPAPALGLLYLLRFGRYAALPLALAIFFADAWVRGFPVSLFASVCLAVVLTFGYWAIAEILRRRLSSRSAFEDRQGLFTWTSIIAVGIFINSAVYIAMLTLGGLIPLAAVREAFVRYWVGDFVGVLVSMPFFWMLLDERGNAQLRTIVATWESLAYLVAIATALWIAFGFGSAADFKYFYVLFLPVMWAATRQGLPGAVLSVSAVQAGVIGSVLWLEISAITVLEIQSLAVVLALSGFFIGVVVDEKQRVSAELRQTLRLAAAGEMAGALAHELNQPLTALSAYGSACKLLLERGEVG